MVDCVELFAYIVFCNLVGYPFLLFFPFFNKQEDEYTELPLLFKLFCEGRLLFCKWLVPSTNCFLQLTGFNTVPSEKASRV